MRVAPISYTDVQIETELLQEYANECSIPALGPAKPNWEQYRQMQSVGVLHGFGLFDSGAGQQDPHELVGFGALLAHVLPHYGVLAGVVESLFVSKSHRGTMGSAMLLYEMEKQATRLGCKALLYSAPVGGQLEAVLGKRYTRTNTVFCKPLFMQ